MLVLWCTSFSRCAPWNNTSVWTPPAVLGSPSSSCFTSQTFPGSPNPSPTPGTALSRERWRMRPCPGGSGESGGTKGGIDEQWFCPLPVLRNFVGCVSTRTPLQSLRAPPQKPLTYSPKPREQRESLQGSIPSSAPATPSPHLIKKPHCPAGNDSQGVPGALL